MYLPGVMSVQLPDVSSVYAPDVKSVCLPGTMSLYLHCGLNTGTAVLIPTFLEN